MNVPESQEASSAAARASADCWELSTMAGRPAARKWVSWSSCSAMSGEMTTVGPVRSSPASS